MADLRSFADRSSVLPLSAVFTVAILLMWTIAAAVKGLVIRPATTPSDAFSGGFFGVVSGTASVAGREITWRPPAADAIALVLVLAAIVAVARRRNIA